MTIKHDVIRKEIESDLQMRMRDDTKAPRLETDTTEGVLGVEYSFSAAPVKPGMGKLPETSCLEVQNKMSSKLSEGELKERVSWKIAHMKDEASQLTSDVDEVTPEEVRELFKQFKQGL